MDWFEVVGYVASALVAVSLMMRRVIRLRIVNLVGAVLFALYGLLIGAVPILIVNVVINGSRPAGDRWVLDLAATAAR